MRVGLRSSNIKLSTTISINAAHRTVSLLVFIVPGLEKTKIVSCRGRRRGSQRKVLTGRCDNANLGDFAQADWL